MIGLLVIHNMIYNTTHYLTTLKQEQTTRTMSMIILENGNIGIGTNNPQEKLHVAGDILLNNGWASGSYSKIIGDTVSARKVIWWYYDNNPSGTQIRDNHSIGFSQEHIGNGNWKMNIKNDCKYSWQRWYWND